MKQHSTRRFEALLSGMGVLSIVVGVLIVVFSFVVIHPGFAALSQIAGKPVGTIQAAGPMVDDLASTLYGARDTLNSVADALKGGSHTTEQAKKGVTGLLAPKKELTENTIDLSKTSDQVRALADKVGRLGGASARLAEGVHYDGERVERVRKAFGGEYLPWAMTLVGVGGGALFVILGLLLMAAATAIKAIIETNLAPPQAVRERGSRAA